MRGRLPIDAYNPDRRYPLGTPTFEETPIEAPRQSLRKALATLKWVRALCVCVPHSVNRDEFTLKWAAQDGVVEQRIGNAWQYFVRAFADGERISQSLIESLADVVEF